ncbi:MAG: hypothetical protein ACMUHM_09655, partial [Thermoplasmatota archaeon]
FDVSSSGIQEKNGTWSISVGCTQAGDIVGPLGRVRVQDTGNEWTMTVSIEYRYRVENTD